MNQKGVFCCYQMKYAAFVSVVEILHRNQSGAFCSCQMKHIVFVAEKNGMGQEMTAKRNQESNHCSNFKA